MCRFSSEIKKTENNFLPFLSPKRPEFGSCCWIFCFCFLVCWLAWLFATFLFTNNKNHQKLSFALQKFISCLWVDFDSFFLVLVTNWICGVKVLNQSLQWKTLHPKYQWIWFVQVHFETRKIKVKAESHSELNVLIVLNIMDHQLNSGTNDFGNNVIPMIQKKEIIANKQVSQQQTMKNILWILTFLSCMEQNHQHKLMLISLTKHECKWLVERETSKHKLQIVHLNPKTNNMSNSTKHNMNVSVTLCS